MWQPNMRLDTQLVMPLTTSAKNFRIVFYIDEYEKQIDGKLKRVNRIRTFNKSDYNTMLYNLSDRLIKNYIKVEEVYANKGRLKLWH